MNKPGYCITTHNISIAIDSKFYTIPKEDSRYNKAIEAIKKEDWEALPNILDRAAYINSYSNNQFSVKDGLIYINGEDTPMPEALSKRVIAFMEEGLPFQPLINFWNRLKKNPSYITIQRLYDCLERNHHPITPEGYVLAYKAVRRGNDGNLWDCYTFGKKESGKGTFRNNVGDIVKMERGTVNDDPNVHCSAGLHCSSYQYAAHVYGSRDDVLVEVLVDPANVVSVPKDHDSQKFRTCEYKVVGINQEKIERDDELVDEYDYYEDSDFEGEEDW